MTKKEIIEKISVNTGLTQAEARDLFETVMSIMKNTLETGEEIKIARFGKFVVKQKKDRKGRNPHTGEEAIISARRVLTFKPSVGFRLRVNGVGEANGTA